MWDWLKPVEYWVFTKINHDGAFMLGDQFFPWVTDLHKLIYFKYIAYPLVLFFFVKKFSRKGVSYFLFLILSLGISDFTGSLVKNYFERPRPFDNSELTVIQKSAAGGKSFYSNHASNMFTFATYTSQFFPIIKIPLYVIATIIAYSRIYNGVHYPSDVFVGALMGLLWGLIFSYLIKLIFKKLSSEKAFS